MKITDVKLIYAKHYLFVHIYTDEGIVGLGEAGNWGHLMATAEAIKKFSTYLIGKDPSRIDDIGQNLYRSLYFRGSVIMSAISAIDIALWDIKGKKLGVPVYELLGGKTRDKVRVYASPMHKETDPEALKQSYRELKETLDRVFRQDLCQRPHPVGERRPGRVLLRPGGGRAGEGGYDPGGRGKRF